MKGIFLHLLKTSHWLGPRDIYWVTAINNQLCLSIAVLHFHFLPTSIEASRIIFIGFPTKKDVESNLQLLCASMGDSTKIHRNFGCQNYAGYCSMQPCCLGPRSTSLWKDEEANLLPPRWVFRAIPQSLAGRRRWSWFWSRWTSRRMSNSIFHQNCAFLCSSYFSNRSQTSNMDSRHRCFRRLHRCLRSHRIGESSNP